VTPNPRKIKRSGKKFRMPGAPPPDQIERAHDATRLYAHRYRERGRFGSPAAHGGYADDDHP
jgi:hypothetical protein